MKGVRLVEPDDVDQVASLWQKCFRKSSRPPSAAMRQCFVDIFLSGPQYDPAYRPLAYVAGDGKIIGFLGRMHRLMQFKGRTIHCAVASQLMVDPDRSHPFCAFELVRALHDGPQDMAYSDGATEVSWRLWERCRGEACPLLSIEWSRSLRPTQAFFERFREHETVGSLARMLQPCSGIFDAVAVRTLPRICHKPRTRTHWHAATAAEILPLMHRLAARVALSPLHTEESLAWLLNRAAEPRAFGTLRTQVVTDAHDQPIGWFVYYARRGHRAYVLQAGAIPGEGERVLACLFRDAWVQDASSVTGQMDALLLADLSKAHCQLHCRGVGVVMQCRDPELALAVHRGDALLSRLDGEWWMRFGIDRNSEW